MARPSNKDLQARALELAKELGMDADDLNLEQGNAELIKLVEDLEALSKDEGAEEAKAKAEEEAKAKAEEEAKAKAETKPTSGHRVVMGKAVTSKRGIFADHDEISAEDLPGGADTLAKLVKSGHVEAV